jgi:Ca-activated chloride channel family protein
LGWLLSAVLAGSVGWTGAKLVFSEPPPPTTLKILVGSELEDLLTSDLMTDVLREETGITLEHAAAGSLEGAELIAQDPAAYDLAWFASDAYVELLEDGPDVTTSEPVMTSPVVIAVEPDVAGDLGWADNDVVSWADVAAAVDGGFRFGMTDPEFSNSGFSALVSVAQSDDGLVRRIFAGQAARPTSSGFLTDQYRAGAFDVDGMINYESEVLGLTESGPAQEEDLVLVHPSEGSVIAQYPVMLLSSDQEPAYDRFVRWLREPDTQEELSRLTHMRPAVDGIPQSEAIGDITPTALELPPTLDEVEAILDTYVDEAGPVSRTVFVLDMSGSMNDSMSTTCPADRQTRLDELKCAFGELTRPASEPDGAFPTLRQDERLFLLPYRATPLPPSEFVMDAQQDRAGVTSYVDGLTGAGGKTGLYDALVEAYQLAAEDGANDSPHREYLTTIVLITDGDSNVGRDQAGFREWREERRQTLFSYDAPLFVAMLGAADADKRDLERLAEDLGGTAVDVYGPVTLSDAIRSIREQ